MLGNLLGSQDRAKVQVASPHVTLKQTRHPNVRSPSTWMCLHRTKESKRRVLRGRHDGQGLPGWDPSDPLPSDPEVAWFPQEGPHLQRTSSAFQLLMSPQWQRITGPSGATSIPGTTQLAGPPPELTSSSLPCVLRTPPVSRPPKLQARLRQKRDISTASPSIINSPDQLLLGKSGNGHLAITGLLGPRTPQRTSPARSQVSQWYQT